MKYLDFLVEIRRSVGVSPEKEDPKAKTTPMRKKLRDAGDVGLKDTVAQVTGKPVTSGQDYRKRGAQIATAATGVEFGDKADPVDAALDKLRGPARYQAQQQAKLDAQIKTEKDPARAKQLKDQRKELDQGMGADEFEKLPLSQRMDIAGSAAGEAGRLTGTKEVDDALRDARLAAEKPRLRDPVKVGDADVYDRAYLRHGYQASGVDLPRMTGELPDIDDDEGMIDYIERQDEFLDTIGVANIDPQKSKTDKTRGGMLDVSQALDRSGIETDRIRTPSVRDLENITPEAEEMGVEAGKEYLTPEVLEKQAKLRKALSTMDSAGVQELAFQHEVSDDLLDRFIDRYGESGERAGKKGKKKLLARIEGAGATAPEYAKYGGESLFDGDVPEEFLPKNKDGSIDRDAPAGVYDLKAIKKSKQYKHLYSQAIENRARETIRTYLKQGGTDGYASHEGVRSMTDMDLEHIRSLRAEAEPGEESAGGYDHPDNYVWASGQLNKLRGASPMDQRAAKYVEGLPTADNWDKAGQKRTFSDFMDNMSPEQQSDLKSALKTISFTAKGVSQNVGAHLKRSQEDIDSDREVLTSKYGMSDEQAKAAVPDIDYDKDAVVQGRNIAGEEDRMAGTPYPTDPEQYAQDVRTNERDYLMFNAGLAELKKKYPGKLEKQLLATPEGEQLLAGLRRQGPAKTRERTKSDKVGTDINDLDIDADIDDLLDLQ